MVFHSSTVLLQLGHVLHDLQDGARILSVCINLGKLLVTRFGCALFLGICNTTKNKAE